MGLLFWLNGHLLNIWEKIATLLWQKVYWNFKGRIELRDLQCNFLEKNKLCSSPVCLHGNQENATNNAK